MSINKRIISNTDWFEEYRNVYNIKKMENSNLIDTISKVKYYTTADIVIINSASRLLFYHCIAKILCPSVKCSIISIDLILSFKDNKELDALMA